MSNNQKRKRILKQKNKKYIDKIKSKGCIICGEKELCCLEFHHIDPTNKIDSVVNMLNKEHELLKKEVNKCVVLCANCHRKVHANIIQLNYANNKSNSISS